MNDESEGKKNLKSQSISLRLEPARTHISSSTMAKTKAVTHADLAPTPKGTELGSKTGACLMVLTVLCGLFCFILCLIAEATRSQVTWLDEKGSECVYSGSGKTPLLCAAIAFLGLAVAMVVQHMYILIAISKSPPPALVSWDPDYPPAKSITWQAGFFFVSTWVCFAVGEMMLLIGLGVESGHLKNWDTPKKSCLIIRGGLFSASGVFALSTVFLATGLYLTALRAQKISKELEDVHREVLQTSVLYAHLPLSPPHQITAVTRENPVVREPQTLLDMPTGFTKHASLV